MVYRVFINFAYCEYKNSCKKVETEFPQNIVNTVTFLLSVIKLESCILHFNYARSRTRNVIRVLGNAKNEYANKVEAVKT